MDICIVLLDTYIYVQHGYRICNTLTAGISGTSQIWLINQPSVTITPQINVAYKFSVVSYNILPLFSNKFLFVGDNSAFIANQNLSHI